MTERLITRLLPYLDLKVRTVKVFKKTFLTSDFNFTHSLLEPRLIHLNKKSQFQLDFTFTIDFYSYN
jgi:hypothetical protein